MQVGAFRKPHCGPVTHIDSFHGMNGALVFVVGSSEVSANLRCDPNEEDHHPDDDNCEASSAYEEGGDVPDHELLPFVVVGVGYLSASRRTSASPLSHVVNC